MDHGKHFGWNLPEALPVAINYSFFSKQESHPDPLHQNPSLLQLTAS